MSQHNGLFVFGKTADHSSSFSFNLVKTNVFREYCAFLFLMVGISGIDCHDQASISFVKASDDIPRVFFPFVDSIFFFFLQIMFCFFPHVQALSEDADFWTKKTMGQVISFLQSCAAEQRQRR